MLAESLLYDNCVRMFLVRGLGSDVQPFTTFDETAFLFGLEYIEVEEPVGFDGLQFKMERDLETYGFTPYASLDALSFDCTSGREFVDEVFTLEGSDADVKFLVIVNDTVQLVNSLNFNNYSRDIDASKLNLENSAFDHKLTTREDTPYSYSLPEKVFLHSKSLPQVTQYPKSTYLLFEDFETKPTNLNTITESFGLINAYRELSEIEGTHEYPMQMTYFNPEGEIKYLMKPLLGGRYTIHVDTILWAYNNPNFATYRSGENSADYHLWNGNLTMVLKVFNTTTATAKYETEMEPTAKITNTNELGTGERWGDRAYRAGRTANVFKESISVDVAAGDEVYLYFRYTQPVDISGNQLTGDIAWGTTTGRTNSTAKQNTVIRQMYNLERYSSTLQEWYPIQSQYLVDPNLPSVEIEGLTIQKNSIAQLARVGNALEEITKKIMGDYSRDFIKSSLSRVAGGPLYDLMIGNGYAIRTQVTGNEVTKPTASFKSLIMGMRSLVNAGYNVEFGPDGGEVVAVEQMDYFFQDSEIITFLAGTIYTYEENVTPENIYSDVEVGYQKFSKNKETSKRNTIDDPHGVLSFSTPIKRHKNLLDLKSDFILSAFEIETTRRKQYEEVSSNERDDSEVFGVQVSKFGLVTELVYEYLDPVPSPWKIESQNSIAVFSQGNFWSLPFVEGEFVDLYYNNVYQVNRRVKRISNVSSLNKFTTFVEFEGNIPQISFENLTDLKIVLPSPRYFPESTQPFANISGVEDTPTYYNLRWSPKRILKNWGKIVNAGLCQKDGEELVLFQKSEGNSELSTKFKDSETNILGDILRAQVKESDDMTLTQLYGRQVNFKSYQVRFTSIVTANVANYIRACHQGISKDDNNYGYIQVSDGRGNLLRGYLVDYLYSPYSGELELTLGVSQTLPILDADIVNPFTDDQGKTFVNEDGQYIQTD